MLTHRALVTEYLACIIALDLRAEDRPLHALPLHHSAPLHAFVMPYLLLGATSWLAESPMPGTILDLVERFRIDGFFAPPARWCTDLPSSASDTGTSRRSRRPR